MPFHRKKVAAVDFSRSSRPALGISVQVVESASVTPSSSSPHSVKTPRAPTTASPFAPTPPPAFPAVLEASGTRYSLLLPEQLPPPTSLRLVVRLLEEDRWVELDVSKELRMGQLKRMAMRKFGLLGDGEEGERDKGVQRGGSTRSAVAAGVSEKGKGKEEGGEEDVLRIKLPHSMSFPGPRSESAHPPSLSVSTSAIPSFPSQVSPLTQPQAHDDFDLRLPLHGSSPLAPLGSASTPGSTSCTPRGHARSGSIQSEELTPFSLHQSTLDWSPHPALAPASGKRARSATTTAGGAGGDGRSLARSLVIKGKAVGEGEYTLVNVVMGCHFDDNAIVGKVLVQYDVLTLLPKTLHFDPPLREYHLPYLRKQCYIYKQTNGGQQSAEALKTAKVVGKWVPRLIEVDERRLIVYKDATPPGSSTLYTTYPLPLVSLYTSPASHLPNLTTSDSSSSALDPSHSVLLLGFGAADRRTCVVRARSARDFADLMRVLACGDGERGGIERQGEGFRGEMDRVEWRVNAINLAHASRHNHLPSSQADSSPRRKLELRASFTRAAPAPAPTSPSPSRAPLASMQPLAAASPSPSKSTATAMAGRIKKSSTGSLPSGSLKTPLAPEVVDEEEGSEEERRWERALGAAGGRGNERDERERREEEVWSGLVRG